MYRFPLLAAVLMITGGQMQAGSRALSSIWSFGGIGLGYEHDIDGNIFIQADLKADLSEVFRGQTWTPGACASFTYNFIFGKSETKDGATLNYFAGPGAIAGWARDHNSMPGAVFGIKGRIGIEGVFERRISISACISPILGMHLSSKKDEINMRLYRNGLIYSLLPEIGIKFTF